MRLASEITRSPAFPPSVRMTRFFSNLLGECPSGIATAQGRDRHVRPAGLACYRHHGMQDEGRPQGFPASWEVRAILTGGARLALRTKKVEARQGFMRGEAGRPQKFSTPLRIEGLETVSRGRSFLRLPDRSGPRCLFVPSFQVGRRTGLRPHRPR
jgi:hypothetical protein